jgi:ABC-type branched-subunit amino acid transport system ATPase component/branched-subunit amino acid ABC-type transport system permease component
MAVHFTMKSLLPFIISGIATGSIYALAATGLVLTYKTSGIFNFGHGAIATAAAYVFYFLYVDHKWHWAVSFGLAVFVFGPLIGLLMERVARRLTPQRAAWKIVGTIGLILCVQGLGTIRYGHDPLPVEQFFPKSNDVFRFGGVVFQWASVIVTLISLITVSALYVLFRGTRLGVQMQAVVDDADLLDLQGTNPVRVRRISWVIGSTLAALSGVLLVPFIGLTSITLTFLVMTAFGAAALGAFSSIPLTYFGAILIGIGASLSVKFTLRHPGFSGLKEGLAYIVLFVALLVIPKRKLVSATTNEARPGLEWKGPWQLRILAGVVIFGVLAAVPTFAGTKLGYWTIGLAFTIELLAIGLLVRTAGLVSLCTSTFAGIGAVVFSQLAVEHHVPFGIAMLAGGLVAAVVGALVALPTIRLSGLFLALGTFGFGVIVANMFYGRGFMFTTLATGRPMPRPQIAHSDRAFYWFALAVVAVVVLLIGIVHRGRLGRLLKGLGDAPTAISTLGLSTNLTRVIVFCISSFIAAIAGIIYGSQVGSAETVDVFYLSFASIALIAILAVAPFRDPWFAIFGGVTQVIPQYPGVATVLLLLVAVLVCVVAVLTIAKSVTSATSSRERNQKLIEAVLGIGVVAAITGFVFRPYLAEKYLSEWLTVLFGFAAVRLAMEGGHHAMPAGLRPFFASIGPSARAKVEAPNARANNASNATVAKVASEGLTVRELTVRFGGLIAVNDVSLQAPTGRITGLIGPNGAGKTTTFNACSGLNKPLSGIVSLHGKNISASSPGSRARMGLGRSFQIMQLAESLTVRENVALGREASQAGGSVLGQLFASARDQRDLRIATDEAMELCGISGLADLQAGSLSTGQRRLVELARCLAGPFDVLLLDEPSSGLDHSETVAFGGVLTRVVAQRGCGILLVEHDMELVMEICSYIYVLNFGEVLFEGTPSEVKLSPVVRQAYLGDDAGADTPAVHETLTSDVEVHA